MLRRFVAVAVAVAFCACKPKPSEPVVDKLELAPGKDEVSLLFVGDMSVARGITDVIDKQGKGDTLYPFERIQPFLEKHDLVFANLECVLSDSVEEEAVSKTYRIRAATKYAASLKEAGVDVVSVANNHALDFGAQGFNATLATVRKEGLFPIGHVDEKGWKQPVRIVQVGKFKVGFLGYNQHGDEYKHDDWRPTPMRYNTNEMADDIKRARPLVDFLVVSVHGGMELAHEAVEWQMDGARKAIDAGADAWIGHHPHVVQPWTIYKDKVVAYSLGDFLFDKSSPWLVHRNRPRLFLKIDLKRVDGKVVGTPTFLTGDQETQTYRPFEAPGSFDIDSFKEPPLVVENRLHKYQQQTFRDLLPTAKVERVKKDVVTACGTWDKRRIPLQGHAFRWLAPRWSCAEGDAEKKRPWETVAPTAELFQGKLKRGIWAHPHEGGPLRLRFPAVTLGTKLEGYGGVPDWGLELETILQKKKKETSSAAAPVRVKVLIEGVAPAAFEVPIQEGVTPFSVDTSAVAGKAKDVVVEIEGGSGDRESRFAFDLWVPRE